MEIPRMISKGREFIDKDGTTLMQLFGVAAL